MGAEFYLYHTLVPRGLTGDNVAEVARSIVQGWTAERFLEVLTWVNEDTSLSSETTEAAEESGYDLSEDEESDLRDEIADLMVRCFGEVDNSSRRIARAYMHGIDTWCVGDMTWGDTVELSDELMLLEVTGLASYGWSKEKMREALEDYLTHSDLPEK